MYSLNNVHSLHRAPYTSNSNKIMANYFIFELTLSLLQYKQQQQQQQKKTAQSHMVDRKWFLRMKIVSLIWFHHVEIWKKLKRKSGQVGRRSADGDLYLLRGDRSAGKIVCAATAHKFAFFAYEFNLLNHVRSFVFVHATLSSVFIISMCMAFEYLHTAFNRMTNSMTICK